MDQTRQLAETQRTAGRVTMKHRVAACLYADVSGYCRLIEATGIIASGQLLIAFASQDKPALAGRATSVLWRYYLYAGSEFLPVHPTAGGTH